MFLRLGILFLSGARFGLSSQSSTQALLQAALQLHKGSRFAEAVPVYRKLLQTAPKSDSLAPIWNNLGGALLALEKKEEAIEAFMSALDLRPTYPDAHLNIAIAAHGSGDKVTARRHVDQALVLNPSYAKALHLLGIILQESGDAAGAEAAFRAAEETASSNSALATLTARAAALPRTKEGVVAVPSFPDPDTAADTAANPDAAPPTDDISIVRVADSPDAFVVDEFVPPAHLRDFQAAVIAEAKSRLKPSSTFAQKGTAGRQGVVAYTGAARDAAVRTSWNAWVPIASHPLLASVVARAAAAVRAPPDIVARVTEVQVVRYVYHTVGAESADPASAAPVACDGETAADGSAVKDRGATAGGADGAADPTAPPTSEGARTADSGAPAAGKKPKPKRAVAFGTAAGGTLSAGPRAGGWGEAYGAHYDATRFLPRFTTVLIYLGDGGASPSAAAGGGSGSSAADPGYFAFDPVEATDPPAARLEGTTIFPRAVPAPVAVRSEAGRACIFHNFKHDGTIDPASLHAGVAVGPGQVKWAMNVWFEVPT